MALVAIEFKQSLRAAINKWVVDNCEEDDWPTDVVVGNDTVDYMAEAAFSVFCGITEAIQYGKREGMLSEN
jgi:hypothetical protein